jgi:murein DD-endopeptidase MepM/ murein hydrolase activator NlpD
MINPGPAQIEIRATDLSGDMIVLPLEVTVLATVFDSENIVLSAETSRLLEPDLVAREYTLLAELWSSSTGVPFSTEGFQLPVREFWPVSSPFGQRRSYNGGAPTSFHSGIDYSAKTGALVLAPAAGEVVLTKSLDVRGKAIVLDHGAGVHSGYWHLSSILVNEGDLIERGYPLGRVGSTGLSTGSHLHWEVRVGNTPVNPLQWVQHSILGDANGQE